MRVCHGVFTGPSPNGWFPSTMNLDVRGCTIMCLIRPFGVKWLKGCLRSVLPGWTAGIHQFHFLTRTLGGRRVGKLRKQHRCFVGHAFWWDQILISKGRGAERQPRRASAWSTLEAQGRKPQAVGWPFQRLMTSRLTKWPFIEGELNASERVVNYLSIKINKMVVHQACFCWLITL